MTPTVSFIVPVFNGAPWVERALTSLQRQTYPDFEAIVVDDGSQDGSHLRCQAFAQTDPRFSIYPIAHCGLSGARNFGLSKIKGAYVGFLDADDWLEDDFTLLLLNAMQSQGADIVSCHSVPAQTPCRNVSGLPRTAQVQRYTPEEYLVLEYQDPMVNVRVGNRLYVRRLFDHVTFPDGMLYEDVVTNYRLCRQCRAAVHVSAPLHNYFVGNESITRSPLREKDFDLLQQWDQVCQMAMEDIPMLVPVVQAMQLTALRALADKYSRYGGDADTERTLVHAFRKALPLTVRSRKISMEKKLRTLAGSVSLPAYQAVTKLIRKDN